MARFRAPSGSLASISSASIRSTHAQDTKSPKLHTTSQRTHADRQGKAKAAAKRAHKQKRLAEPSIAYVGNISPEVDEDALKAHFSGCGNVLSARIHCCGGVAMTVQPASVSYHQNMKVRQYGIVVFESRAARRRACQLGGTLGGRELVVAIAVSDLPEVQEKIAERLEDYRSRLEPPDLRRTRTSVPRATKREPTVLLDPKQEDGRKLRRQFQFMDLTFRGGIV